MCICFRKSESNLDSGCYGYADGAEYNLTSEYQVIFCLYI